MQRKRTIFFVLILDNLFQGHCLCRNGLRLVRVHPGSLVSLGCSSNRKMPPSQGGDRGAIPRRSTASEGIWALVSRPVCYTGSPGEGEMGSTPIPSARCPGGETDIMPRFERGVPGSTPGRGTVMHGVHGVISQHATL